MLEKYDEAEEKLKAEYENRIMEIENENEKLKKKIAKLKQWYIILFPHITAINIQI